MKGDRVFLFTTAPVFYQAQVKNCRLLLGSLFFLQKLTLFKIGGGIGARFLKGCGANKKRGLGKTKHSLFQSLGGDILIW